METLQEVSLAQSKLSEIMSAINREQLTIEEKVKEVTSLKKQEKDLSTKVGILSNEVTNLTNRNSELAEKYKQELIAYESQRNDLILESKEIESDNSTILKKYVEDKRQLQANIESLESEYAKKEKSLSTKLEAVQTKVDNLNDEKEQLLNEIKSIKGEITSMKIALDAITQDTSLK